jgi:hypothetical protein
MYLHLCASTYLTDQRANNGAKLSILHESFHQFTYLCYKREQSVKYVFQFEEQMFLTFVCCRYKYTAVKIIHYVINLSHNEFWT